MNLSETNIHLFRLINNLGKQYPFLNPVFRYIAEYTLYILIIMAIIFLLTKRNRNTIMVICSMIAIAIAEIIGKIAGRLHSNLQPFAELSNVNQLIEKAIDNSFPSDHTILVFALCFSFWIFKRGWHLLWVFLAALVGISRIGVGVHYPADVVVGALISILSVFLVYRIIPNLRFVQKRFGEHKDNHHPFLDQ